MLHEITTHIVKNQHCQLLLFFLFGCWNSWKTKQIHSVQLLLSGNTSATYTLITNICGSTPLISWIPRNQIFGLAGKTLVKTLLQHLCLMWARNVSSPRSTQIIQFVLLDAQCLLIVTFQVLRSCLSVATRASNPWLFIRKQKTEKKFKWAKHFSQPWQGMRKT